MRNFPLFIKLAGRRVIVAGDTDAAAAKLRLLAETGASIKVFAEHPDHAFHLAAETASADIEYRRFTAEDFDHAVLAIAATGNADEDARFSTLARAAGIPVNIVDRPELSDFAMPAIIDRAPIQIAVSTNGSAPALARHVREMIEAALPARIGGLARFADRFRDTVRQVIPGFAARKSLWNKVFTGPIGAQVLAGEEQSANAAMVAMVNRTGAGDAPDGHVAIVGAGPGDADLLTLRALNEIQRADVIVYDRLVGDEILKRARRDARLVFVGKTPGNHHKSQDEINDILLDEARAGHYVVRLKGGDPFIFGRGGEEQLHLNSNGISTSVVPGITAAAACSAAAGVPLTHRGAATSVTLVTGQGAENTEAEVDWKALAGARQTIAVYMGVGTADLVSNRLQAAGRSGQTPVAVIENGSRPDQRIITSTLADLPDDIVRQNVKAPALIIIGEVAALAKGEPLPAEIEHLTISQQSASKLALAL